MKNWYQRIASYSGVVISIVAIAFVIRLVNGEDLHNTLRSIKPGWLIPVILINFIVIILKALRWQLLVQPLSRIGLFKITGILIVSLMANNILPARLGDALRVHMLHRKTDLGHATSTGGLIADRMLEGISFLLLTALLFFIGNVPQWMHYGILVTLAAVAVAYVVVVIYSRSEIRRGFWMKLQKGIAPLHNRKVFGVGTGASLLSWLLQLVMIYFTQLAFGIHLPIWSTLLVLVAVNLAIIVPSTPANIGTFELACVLAYTFLGVDRNVGLLIGATYHLAQVLPVTMVGAVLLLVENINPWRVASAPDPDEVCCQ